MEQDSFSQFGNSLDPVKKKKKFPIQNKEGEGVALPNPLDLESKEIIPKKSLSDSDELNFFSSIPDATRTNEKDLNELDFFSGVDDDIGIKVPDGLSTNLTVSDRVAFSFSPDDVDAVAVENLLAKESANIPLFKNTSGKEIINFLNLLKESDATVGETIDKLFKGDTEEIKNNFKFLGLDSNSKLSEFSNFEFLKSFSSVGRVKEIALSQFVKEKLNILDAIETPDGDVSTIDGKPIKVGGKFTKLGESVLKIISEVGDEIPISLQSETSIVLQEMGRRFQNATNSSLKNVLRTVAALGTFGRPDGEEARKAITSLTDETVDNILKQFHVRERFNIDEISDVVNPFKFGIAVAEQAPNLLSATAITVASPQSALVTVPAFFATQHFAESLNRLDEIDSLPDVEISDGEKFLRAISITAINTTLDTFSFNLALGRLNPFSRSFANFALTVFAEPTTELAQEVSLELFSSVGVTEVQYRRLVEIGSQAFYQSLPLSILTGGLGTFARNSVGVDDAATPVITINEDNSVDVKFRVIRKESSKVGELLTESELEANNLPVPEFRAEKLRAQLKNVGISNLDSDAFIGLLEIQAESNGMTLDGFLLQHNLEINGTSAESAKISIDEETKRVIQGLSVDNTLSHIETESISEQLAGRLEYAKELKKGKINNNIIKALTGWFLDPDTKRWRISLNPLEFNLSELKFINSFVVSLKGLVVNTPKEGIALDKILTPEVLQAFPDLAGFKVVSGESNINLTKKVISLDTSKSELEVQQELLSSVQSVFEIEFNSDAAVNLFSILSEIRNAAKTPGEVLKTFIKISKSSEEKVFSTVKQFLKLRFGMEDPTNANVEKFINTGKVNDNLEISSKDSNIQDESKPGQADINLITLLIGLRNDAFSQAAANSLTESLKIRNRLEKNRPNAFFSKSGEMQQNDEPSPNSGEIKNILSAVKRAKDIKSLLHAYSEFLIGTLSPKDLKTAEKVFKVKNGIWTRNNINAFADSFLAQVRKGVSSNGSLAPIFSLFRTGILQAGDIYFEENNTLPKGFNKLLESVFKSYDSDLASLDMDKSENAWKGMTLSIERMFRKLGQPKTGKAVRSMFSVVQGYINIGRIRLKEITKLVNKTDKNLLDILLLAESKSALEEARKSNDKNLEAAIVAVRDYFKSMGDDLLAVGGLSRTFQERLADDLQQLRDKGEITDVEYADRLADIQDLEFVNIDYAAISAFLDSPNAVRVMNVRNKNKTFGLKTGKKRRAVTLKEAIASVILGKLVAAKEITLEEAANADADSVIKLVNTKSFDATLIFSSYSKKVGNDIALSTLRNAAILEKIAVTEKEANSKLGYQKAAVAGGLFKGLLLAPHLNNIMISFANAEKKGSARRIITAVKLFQFVNPLMLGQYSVILSSMLTSSNTLHKLPGQMIKAIQSLLNADDLYKRAALNNAFSEVSVDPRRVVEDEFRRAGYSSLQNAKATIKGIFEPFSEEPAFKNFVVNTLRASNNAISKIYDGLSSIAWGFENVFRMTNFISLVEDGETDAKAGELASRVHADFSDIPPDARAALNVMFFTPSYKVAMVGLLKDSIKSLTQITRGDSTITNARLGSAFLKGFMILGGIDLFLLSMGFERERFGYVYVKKLPTQAGEKDAVVTIALPINLFLKFMYRLQRSFEPDVLNPITKFLKSNEGEVTPLLKIVNQLITGKNVFGEDIVKPGEEVFGTGGLKLIKHGLAEAIPITKVFIDNDQRERSPKEIEALTNQLGAIGVWSADVLANLYIRTTQDQISANRVTAFSNELKKIMSSKEDRRNILGLQEIEDPFDRIKRILAISDRLEKLIDLLIIERELISFETPLDKDIPYKGELTPFPIDILKEDSTKNNSTFTIPIDF